MEVWRSDKMEEQCFRKLNMWNSSTNLGIVLFHNKRLNKSHRYKWNNKKAPANSFFSFIHISVQCESLYFYDPTQNGLKDFATSCTMFIDMCVYHFSDDCE